MDDTKITKITQLVSVFEKLATDAQQELEDLQNQITLKKHELAELEKECENKKVIALMATELPREIQREVMSWMLPNVTKYYFVYELKKTSYDCKLCSGIEIVTGKIRSYRLLDDSSYSESTGRELEDIYNQWKNIVNFVGVLNRFGRLTMRFDETECEITRYFNKIVLPREYGFSLIKKYDIIKQYNEKGCLYDDSTSFVHIYEYDSCTTYDSNDPLIKYCVKIRL